MAGIGLGRLLGREHDSTPQSEVEAPRLLKRRISRLHHCVLLCCFAVAVAVAVVVVVFTFDSQSRVQ